MTPKVPWRLRLGRGTRLTLAGAVVVLVVAVPSALAIHDFTDVPDVSPFHADIAAIKRAGITSGKTCDPPATPPTYCPTETINRQAMAAFVHRGFGRAGLDVGAFVAVVPVFPTTTDVAVVTIEIPGVPGQTQFVKLDGSATTVINSSTGCPCTTELTVVRDGGGGPLGQPHYAQNEAVGTGSSGYDTVATTVVDVVPTGTTQTYRLRASRRHNTGGSVSAFAHLSAITAPFGSTGTDVLSATSG